MAKKTTKTAKRVVKRVKAKKKRKPPSPRELLFIREYVASLNASDAARKAGYAYSSAPKTGHQITQKYQAEIENALAVRAKHCEITAERVLREIASLALINIVDIMEFGNGWTVLKNSSELPRHVTAAISEIKHVVTKDQSTVTVKLHKKERCLEMLCQHLGLMDSDGNVKSPEEIREMLDRLQNGDRDNATGIPANAD